MNTDESCFKLASGTPATIMPVYQTKSPVRLHSLICHLRLRELGNVVYVWVWVGSRNLTESRWHRWGRYFPTANINSLLVWGDGEQAGTLEGVSHPRTTAHSCPPGSARALVHLTGCVRLHRHTSLLLLHHLFSRLAADSFPWLCPHHAWSEGSSRSLTDVEHHDPAHSLTDTHTLSLFLTQTYT